MAGGLGVAERRPDRAPLVPDGGAKAEEPIAIARVVLEYALHEVAATELVRLGCVGRVTLASEIAGLPRELDALGFWWSAFGDHGRRSSEEVVAHRADLERRLRGGEAIRSLVAALWDQVAEDARRAVAALAASDHWSLWQVWLRWHEDPDELGFGGVELADAVLRDCAVCAEVRLDVL